MLDPRDPFTPDTDRPWGFVPDAWREPIARAELVVGVQPDGTRTLVFARALRADLTVPAGWWGPPCERVAEVPCVDDEDVAHLQLLVAEVTGEGGIH